MAYTFEYIKYEKSNLVEYCKLLNFVFREKIPKTPEFLDWEYNGNPLGKAYGCNAYYGNELVAHYSAQPIMSIIKGELKKGILALHVATHPEHQGKGLFTIINNRTHEKAFSEGCKFVIGVANKQSTPRYTKKLGFKLIGSLDARVGIGIPKRNYNNYKDYSYRRIWDEKSLEWRLKDPSYEHIAKEKKGLITIYAKTYFPYVYAIVAQFNKDEYKNLSLNNSRKLYGLKIWLGIDKNLYWKLSVKIPISLRPSPLNLIYLNFEDSNDIIDRREILFNNLDFDAF